MKLSGLEAGVRFDALLVLLSRGMLACAGTCMMVGFEVESGWGSVGGLSVCVRVPIA